MGAGFDPLLEQRDFLGRFADAGTAEEKADVAAYYAAVMPLILPEVIGRPDALFDPTRVDDIAAHMQAVLGDEQLAQLMTLWSQGGSNVIRGHVLSIPIGDAIVHIEPIYLESQSSSFPELQLVAVMQGDQLGYGPSLDAALQMLFGQRPATAPSRPAAGR